MFVKTDNQFISRIYSIKVLTYEKNQEPKEEYISLSNDELIYEEVKEYDLDGNVIKSEKTWHNQDEEEQHNDFLEEIDAMDRDDDEDEDEDALGADVQLLQKTDGQGRTIESSLDGEGEEIIHRVLSPAGQVLFKADYYGGKDQFFRYDSEGRLTDKYTLYSDHERHEYTKSGNCETETIIITDFQENHDFEDDIISFDDYYASVIEGKAWSDGIILKRKEMRCTRNAHSIDNETIETEYWNHGTEENRSYMVDYLNVQGQTFQRRIQESHNGELVSKTIINYDSSGRLVESFTREESGASRHTLNFYIEDWTS